MATCNYADTTGEKSYKGPLHSLISPRFLKSQPVPGNSTRIKAELDRRLIQSQPASQTESFRFVNYMKFVVVFSLIDYWGTLSIKKIRYIYIHMYVYVLVKIKFRLIFFNVGWFSIFLVS